MSWGSDQAIPTGRRMTFKQALHVVSTDMALKLVVPEWAMGLTQKLRNVRIAFEEFEVRAVVLSPTWSLINLLAIYG
jgi:hypothetical protein